MRSTNLHPSELEDFKNELKRRKRGTDEFEIVEQVQLMTGTGIQPQRGTVTIRHIASHVERTYSTDSGNTWVAEFIRDLDDRTF